MTKQKDGYDPDEKIVDKYNLDVTKELKNIGLVLENANQVESKLAAIIGSYIDATGRGGQFLRSHILHASITSYASKVKLALAINKKVGGGKLNRNALHRIGHLRNGFAHGSIAGSIRVALDVEQEHIEDYVVVESIRGDGEIEEINRLQAFVEFMELIDEIVPQLAELEKLLGESKKN